MTGPLKINRLRDVERPEFTIDRDALAALPGLCDGYTWSDIDGGTYCTACDWSIADTGARPDRIAHYRRVKRR